MTAHRRPSVPRLSAVVRGRRGSRASVRRRALAAAVGLAGPLLIAAPAAAAPPAAAPAARHATATTPILLVHGFDSDFNSAVDCGDRGYITPWVNGLRARGFTNVRPVGFYARDSRCADYVPDRSDNTVNTSINELGRDLANLIYTRYTRHDRAVAVSAHSMGGLVIRAALDGVAKRQPGFPARLRVTDVITSGTPHAGTRFGTRCAARARQCAEFVPGSRFLTNLGQNPQGADGTDWTLIGSRRDEYVPPQSAVAMRRVSTSRPGIAKVVHAPYTHVQLVTEPVPLNRIALGLRTGR